MGEAGGTLLDPVRLIQIMIFLGLVIFVHELGHFLVARWCGVLVERFSVGFGPVLLSFKRGDTEYALSLIPLGGYVKMLGQSDTPTIEGPSEDKRSYQNKSVLQRMAIISAGVVMNIIFGLICFAIAYGVGVPESPATVGAATPGGPAWKAGMMPGDRIINVNGQRDPSYRTFVQQVVFTRPETEKVHITVDRGGKDLEFAIAPIKRNRPMIGVIQSVGLELAPFEEALPTIRFSRAAEAKDPGFERGDRVVAVDGEPTRDFRQLSEQLFQHRRDPVTIRVERRSTDKKPGPEADVKVAEAFVRTAGLVMTMGDIIAIRDDSPAAQAVDATGAPKPIEPGDRILAVDGQAEIDPMRLADVLVDKAGQKVELTIKRKARTPEELKLYVVPQEQPTWSDFPMFPVPTETPMSIPSLGIAYNVASIVYSVEPEGPAARSGKIQPGDFISSITYVVPRRADLPREKGFLDRFFGAPKAEDSTTKEQEYDKSRFRCGEAGWAGAFWGMQSPEVPRVILAVERTTGEQKKEEFEVELELAEVSDWPIAMRGLNLVDDERIRRASTLLEALRLGLDYTLSTMSDVYMTLRGLLNRDLAPDLLSGPLRLGYTAYVVSKDFMTLVLLIGLINVNLAVVNFLPIPVLDGGHMVFLLYEAIFRRKPNEKFLLVMNYVGIIFILSLMAFVIYLDVKNLFFSDM